MKRVDYETHLAHRFDLFESLGDDAEILEGFLADREVADRRIPIKAGIPRFVCDEGYATNFGLQWTTFKKTQFDSYTDQPIFSRRFWENTRWIPDQVRGATVLEAGSGAGSFTEVLLESGARVVSFDLSNAVDANRSSNFGKGDLLLMQADIYDLPLKDESFDFVFCYGVLQHTPDPASAYQALFRKLRPGGRMSVDCYTKTDHLDPWSTPKYAWRSKTSRMDPERLLRIIQAYMPFWLPIDTLLRRIPKIGPKLVAFLRVPCWNHYELGLPPQEHLHWAIMNTFDALGARYDYPVSLEEMRSLVASPDNEEVEVFLGSNGVVANIRKQQ